MPASLFAAVGVPPLQAGIAQAAPASAGTVEFRCDTPIVPSVVSLAVAPRRAVNQVTVDVNAPANAATGEVRIANGLGPDDALAALDTIIARMTADRIGGPGALAIARTLRARMVADRIQGTP